MALITAMVLCARLWDSFVSVSVRRVNVVFSTAGFKDGRNRVLRQVKPPHCGEASRKPLALSLVQTRAIGALARGFTHYALQIPIHYFYAFKYLKMQINGTLGDLWPYKYIWWLWILLGFEQHESAYTTGVHRLRHSRQIRSDPDDFGVRDQIPDSELASGIGSGSDPHSNWHDIRILNKFKIVAYFLMILLFGCFIP